ncbi:hypothetical protein PPACK8108_LOCUS1998 [Phakopsora pachyrhizi]|uniref:CFEM domain-containing protein n=1 Tax=Phakopsora pachyrhizi TaxID=170000 RepID=A0AAV0AI17_PHAPC|nr:hypothetical protein PPACK8108_LOCUS1998 [Phakopsora pachyrhizi]
MLCLKAIVLAIGIVQQATAAVSNSNTTEHSPTQGQKGSENGTCANHCMSVKLTESSIWFGHGNLTVYCQYKDFITAFDNCLSDNCANNEELQSAKKGVLDACAAAGVTSPGTICWYLFLNTQPLALTFFKWISLPRLAKLIDGYSIAPSNGQTPGNNLPAELPAGSGNHNAEPSSTTGSSITGVDRNSTSSNPTTATSATTSQLSNTLKPASAAANSTASAITCSSILIGLSSALAIANL